MFGSKNFVCIDHVSEDTLCTAARHSTGIVTIILCGTRRTKNKLNTGSSSVEKKVAGSELLLHSTLPDGTNRSALDGEEKSRRNPLLPPEDVESYQSGSRLLLKDHQAQLRIFEFDREKHISHRTDSHWKTTLEGIENWYASSSYRIQWRQHFDTFEDYLTISRSLSR